MISNYFKREAQTLDIDYVGICFNWHVLKVGESDSQGRQLVTVNIVTDFEGVDLAEEAIAVVKQVQLDPKTADSFNEVIKMMKAAMTMGELSSFYLQVRLL